MSMNTDVVRAEAADLESEVHVWFYRLDLDPEELSECARVLDNAERERANRFRFEKHRRRFVAGRATLRTILADYAGCGPQAVGFGYAAHGKPYIAGPDRACDLKFSVSNSGDLGAVAITKGAELGLDIECIRPSPDHDMIVEREFSAEERRWYRGLAMERRETAFFELWTCKEAYLKGKGQGLSESLKRFSVSLDTEPSPRLAWSDIDPRDPQRWFLRRVVTEPGYIACLAQDNDGRAIQVASWVRVD